MMLFDIQNINRNRIRLLNNKPFEKKGDTVIYWMERDQRVSDNWALITANQIAKTHNKKLVVLFCLTKIFYGNELRRYDFLINGLIEINKKLSELNIPFILRINSPENIISDLAKEYSISALITDFNPLRPQVEIKNIIANKIDYSFLEVDAHNIVPAWQASDKQEFGARTIRNKINKHLENYLTDFPKLEKLNNSRNQNSSLDKNHLLKSLNLDTSVEPINWLKAGESEAYSILEKFIKKKLKYYVSDRNNPTKKVVSNLSIHLHFGHISTQRIALIFDNFKNDENISSFLEELIIRRELSDNFVFYNKDYDNFNGFANWAKMTLDLHRNDKREYLYSQNKFENAETHDSLWNAAQNQLRISGKMHGYMRMYWAKKILEWSNSPEIALKTAIYLNDKYALDGIDPNGFTGIAWSIGGIHDRAWFERPVYGKIRYMNYNGAKKKFDVNQYISKIETDMYQLNLNL